MRKGVMECDLIAPQVVPWRVMLDDVRYLEQLGIETVWLGDHYVWVPTPDDEFLEAWTALAALAVATTRIRLGTLITNVATRHPAMLAKQAATVDCISGGRSELGLGAGYFEQEHEWLGIPFLTPGGRVDRLHEAVEIIDRLLRGERVTRDGTYFRLHDAPFHPRPIQRPRPPLTIAADGKRALKVAAEYADVWVSGAGGGTPEGLMSYRERNLLLDEYCGAIGRDPTTLKRSSFVWGEEGVAPFLSPNAFQDFVGRHHEAGVERLTFTFASEGATQEEVVAGRLRGRFATRAVLESYAAQAMADLRGPSRTT